LTGSLCEPDGIKQRALVDREPELMHGFCVHWEPKPIRDRAGAGADDLGVLPP
jgi:hypothetical protein